MYGDEQTGFLEAGKFKTHRCTNGQTVVATASVATSRRVVRLGDEQKMNLPFSLYTGRGFHNALEQHSKTLVRTHALPQPVLLA